MNGMARRGARGVFIRDCKPVKQDVFRVGRVIHHRRSPDYRGSWDQNRMTLDFEEKSPASVFADSDTGRLTRNAARASVAVATILIVAKTGAWIVTDSVALLSTLIDSILDAAASLVSLLAVRHALRPADRGHRFGHGKAEPLAGLTQGAFIFGSAIFLFLEAGSRFATPVPVSRPTVGVAVAVLSIVMTAGLVLYQGHVVRRTKSVAISADSLHYKTDLLVNGSVIVSILLAAEPDWGYADPAFAVFIGAYILFGAYRIARRSLNILMDRELSDQERDRIVDIAMAHPVVTGYHDLRTRSSGARKFIQMHLEMDGRLSLLQAHAVAEQVTNEIELAFPRSEALIHQDPEGVAERVARFD